MEQLPIGTSSHSIRTIEKQREKIRKVLHLVLEEYKIQSNGIVVPYSMNIIQKWHTMNFK